MTETGSSVFWITVQSGLIFALKSQSSLSKVAHSLQTVQSGQTVTSDAVKQKACEIANELGVPKEEFSASNGWLARFKQRKGLHAYPRPPAEDPSKHLGIPNLPPLEAARPSFQAQLMDTEIPSMPQLNLDSSLSPVPQLDLRAHLNPASQLAPEGPPVNSSPGLPSRLHLVLCPMIGNSVKLLV